MKINKYLNDFNEKGFCIIKNALSGNYVNNILNKLDQLQTKLNKSKYKKKTFGLNIRPVIDQDDVFLNLIDCKKTFPIIVKILNHYNIQLLQSHLIVVPPNKRHRAIGWHSDGGINRFTVNGLCALTSIKIGYFFTDHLKSDSGSLMVVPGSHKMVNGPVFKNNKKSKTPEVIKVAHDNDPYGAMEIKVKAGDALIFHQGLYHASANNFSDNNRIAIYYCYGYRTLKPIDYTSFPDEFLTKCNPIRKQLLGFKKTHLGYHLPTDDDVPLKKWFINNFGETWNVNY